MRAAVMRGRELSAMFALEVPNGLSSEWAVLTEPMAVGRHAVSRSGITPGKAAVVMGCGPARRALATTMGAHEVVDPAVEPAVVAWQRIDGTKQLVIYEAVGVPGMLDAAMTADPRGARVPVVGVCMEGELDVAPLITGQVDVEGVPQAFEDLANPEAHCKVLVTP